MRRSRRIACVRSVRRRQRTRRARRGGGSVKDGGQPGVAFGRRSRGRPPVGGHLHGVCPTVLLVTRPRRSAPARTRPAQDARPAGVSAATLPAAGVGCRANSSSVDPRHVVDGDHAPQVVAEILIDLLAVALRQEDTAQPAAVRGQHLLGDAAGREHLSTEGDLAGHRHVVGTEPTPREGGDQRGGHRLAG